MSEKTDRVIDYSSEWWRHALEAFNDARIRAPMRPRETRTCPLLRVVFDMQIPAKPIAVLRSTDPGQP